MGQRIGHQDKHRLLACLVFVGLVGLSTSEATAQQLYVGNDSTPGGVQRYNLPITANSTPTFTIAGNNVVAVDEDAKGNLAVGDNAGNLTFFTAPLSGASTPSAAFKNGTTSNGPTTETRCGQIVFTIAGDFFVATIDNGVSMFTHPFSNASTPSLSITKAGLDTAIGVTLDAAQNLYISNAGPGGYGGNLFVYAPPYTGAPIITSFIAGAAYRKIAVSATQLFAASVFPPPGRIDVYNLPITAASVPAFSIISGVSTPKAVALDRQSNLYVGNWSGATVTVFSPPFSSGSVPALTLKVGTSAFAIFGIAIGNSTENSPRRRAVVH